MAEVLEIIKISLAVVAGIGGVIALVIAYRRQRIAEASDAREQTRLHAERLDKAADRLGSESPTVRLAAAHAVAAIGDEWIEGRKLCGEILYAFLRSRQETDPFVQETIRMIFTRHLREWGMISEPNFEQETRKAAAEKSSKLLGTV
ncbi:hypothetical protein [Nonomuraea bangladeshensis]|uniref:hypothetical protein n=1 Tax=Nonomuraea bangladeshensis TaxID=404385 RepID=UPI003C2E592F